MSGLSSPDPCPFILPGDRRCNRALLHSGPHRVCWRCGGRGFIRRPCQACGLWRTSAGELVWMAGSIWGDEAPPMAPKSKRGRRDR